MYYDTKRRPELLQPARLDTVGNQESGSNDSNGILTSFENQLSNINIKEAGCLKNAWCS